MISATKCKRLEVVTLFLNSNKKVGQTKIQLLSLGPQRTELSTTMNSEEKGDSRVIVETLLIGAEAVRLILVGRCRWWFWLTSADDTTLMAESEEELKSLLMKVKVESEKVGLKLNIQNLRKALTWVWQGEENNNSCEIIPVVSQKQRQKNTYFIQKMNYYPTLKFQKKKKKKLFE